MPRNLHSAAVFTISAPTAIAENIERTRRAQHRSRSELARDAFRVYFRAQKLAEDAGRRAYLDAKAGRRLSPIYDTADEFIGALHKATRRPAVAPRRRRKERSMPARVAPIISLTRLRGRARNPRSVADRYPAHAS